MRGSFADIAPNRGTRELEVLGRLAVGDPPEPSDRLERIGSDRLGVSASIPLEQPFGDPDMNDLGDHQGR
jgi:hypothetical protein